MFVIVSAKLFSTFTFPPAYLQVGTCLHAVYCLFALVQQLQVPTLTA